MKDSMNNSVMGLYRYSPSQLECPYPTNYQHNNLCKENSSASSTDSNRAYAVQQMTNKAPRPLALWGAALALMISLACAYVMWNTNVFASIIHQSLILRNNTLRYDTWKHQPIQTYLKVYAFNYTNVHAFESGQDAKLKIQQVGPYTYTFLNSTAFFHQHTTPHLQPSIPVPADNNRTLIPAPPPIRPPYTITKKAVEFKNLKMAHKPKPVVLENVERVNIVFNENETVSYQERKIYKFSPEMSSGGQFDQVVVPNMPYMSAIAMTEQSYVLTRYALSVTLERINARPMLRVPMDDLLWGYEDQLSTMASQLLQIQHDVPFTKFGLLASKNGTQNDILTIHTGRDDINKLGVISRFNGQTRLPHWKTSECNRLDGTDGSMFPPSVIQPNSTLHLYTKDMCRRMPLVSEMHYRQNQNIKVMRFRIPSNVFAPVSEHNPDACYCLRDECPPSGVFDVSPCTYGAPVYTSLPHFLYGESSLHEAFEGLQPKVEEHQSYAEIEPRLGIPISGVSRLQLNVKVKRYPGIMLPAPYKNDLILPVVWMEFGSEELPPDVSSLIKNLLFLVEASDIVLSYGSLIMTLVSLILLLRMLLRRHEVNREQMVLSNMPPSSSRFPLVHKAS